MSDKPRSPFARCYSVPGGFSITVDHEQAIMDNIETIRNMTMPKTTEKPREWIIFGVACAEKGSAAYDNFQWNEGNVRAIEFAAFEKLQAENERLREYNRERFLEFIGVDPKNTCPGCGGIGEKCYSSTATWGGGIGGQALTNAVCDKCWGSGDAARPWANLKQIRIQQQVLTKERDALKAENERLMRERDSYAGYAKLNDELMEERDALKAKLAALDRDHADDWKRIQDAERKLAEVEAENERLRSNETGCQADYANLERELTREREAAKVMREALVRVSIYDAPDIEQLIFIAKEALAKADEIRGGE